MYLSTCHPGINTSPQSHQKTEDTKSENYDGDESDVDINEENHDVISPVTDVYSRFQASSLPDLVGSSFSMSTSTFSLNNHSDNQVECNLEPVKSPNTKSRRKKRRKRRSESDVESPSKNQSRGSPLTISKSKQWGPSFLASTPIQPQLLEIPPLRAHWDLTNSIGRRRGVCGCNSSLTANNDSSAVTNVYFSDTSYLDVTLFTLFYFSDQFDEWVLDEKSAKGFPTQISKEVRAHLRKEILYSLRTSYFCPSSSVSRLFKSVFPTSQPYTLGRSEFSRFFHYFFEKILTLPETVHYTNGSSELIHRLKDYTTTTTPTTTTSNTQSSFTMGHNLIQLSSCSNTATSHPLLNTVQNVQNLFEQSLGDLKLLSTPQPGLFLSVEHPLVVPHDVILPNIQLDLTRTLIQLSDDNDTADEQENQQNLYYPHLTATTNNTRNHTQQSTEESQFCKLFRSMCRIIYEYLQNLVEQFPATTTYYGIDDNSFNTNYVTNNSIMHQANNTFIGESIEDSWSISRPLLTTSRTSDDGSGNKPENFEQRKKKTKKQGKLLLALDLMAVICLEHSPTSYQYTAFVRCGQNPRRGFAPWVYFKPCDQQNSPLVIDKVRRVEDLGKWLNRLEKKPDKVKSLWSIIPSDVQLMLTNSTFFMYTPKPDYESQNTLFSYANEC